MVCFKQLVHSVLVTCVLAVAPEFARGQEANPVERPRPALPPLQRADAFTRTELRFNPNGTIRIGEKRIGKPDAFPSQAAVRPQQDARRGAIVRPGRTLPTITIDSVPQSLLVLGGLFAVCYLAARFFVWAIARPKTPDGDVK